ncbi:hypothetical protein CHBEV_024 [Choristoneura biennis entomopoxvirus]|uniref:Uncharacterized protein n=1 Tax=Choristoneura biennis entomopoxvirus TaxID=10288 RepID=A0A916KPA0_CBEPV|nr:hypothetical protein CHBEV_024 [Choristoneura biennis entomopoxvirus]CCU55592.1 hypothetical protein CHBEV_024 [Choristoneura biennis entomopoxvirus]
MIIFLIFLPYIFASIEYGYVAKTASGKPCLSTCKNGQCYIDYELYSEMNTFYLNMYKLFKNNNFINVINKLKEILYMMRDIINIESINNIFSTISDELE